ncbi:MAG: hypothetical protein U0800_27210 [Isosphaeraceae bacterium]
MSHDEPIAGFHPPHLAISATIAAAVLALLAYEWRRTSPEREATRAFTDMVILANRGNLAGLSTRATARYRSRHPFREAPEGGVVGLPRIPPHPNYRAWRDGPEVRLCPFNRSGPVYRFVREDGAWKFDGLAGLLRHDGRFVPGNWDIPSVNDH